MELSLLLLPLLNKAIATAIATNKALDADELGEDDIKALQSALRLGTGVLGVLRRAGDAPANALYVALVTQSFGVALGRYWGNSPRLSPTRSRLGKTWDKLFDSERGEHAEQIKLRLTHAASTPLDPNRTSAGEEELAVLQRLCSEPLSNPYYKALYTEFSNPEVPGQETEWALAIDNTQEFERYFQYAYIDAMATNHGARVHRWLLGLSGMKSEVLRAILATDMSSWGRCHVFGNARNSFPGDPMPFLPLDDSYVEPYGSIQTPQRPDGGAKRPILELLKEQILDGKVVIVKADFGHGKSLTARRLVRDAARQWLARIEPATEIAYPVFVRCARDFTDRHYDHAQVIRRALWNQARETLVETQALDDSMYSPLSANQAALFVFDDLDEVSLTRNQLEDFLSRLHEHLGPKQRAFVFTRPGALPQKLLADVTTVRLLPFEENAQVQDWLRRWNRLSNKPPICIQQLHSRNLRELASTPILLLMMAITWDEDIEAQPELDQVQLYEKFFRHIANGRYGGSEQGRHYEQHRSIQKAAGDLLDRLVHLNMIDHDDPIEAMLWLMSRVAWEAHHHAYDSTRGALRARHVEYLIEDELTLSKDTLEVVRAGLLLTMQIDPLGHSPIMLFGHQSFREFLVARYWKHQLLERIQEQQVSKWQEIEDRLMRARLLQDEDNAFDLLVAMLQGLEERQQRKIKIWARDYVARAGLLTGNLHENRRAILGESALAIGSIIGPEQGLTFSDEWVLRSLWLWYEYHGMSLRLVAPGLCCPGCMLRRGSFHGADLRGAKLAGADLSCTNLSDANLSDANLCKADLSGANLLGADLCGADLSGASLFAAQLSMAEFSEANLMAANLSLAQLSGTNLRQANLCKADMTRATIGVSHVRNTEARHVAFDDDSGNVVIFSGYVNGANLSGANLSGADLSEANLSRANLGEANLTGATLANADLRGANLEGVVGLTETQLLVAITDD